jgi:hypothetical protein
MELGVVWSSQNYEVLAGIHTLSVKAEVMHLESLGDRSVEADVSVLVGRFARRSAIAVPSARCCRVPAPRNRINCEGWTDAIASPDLVFDRLDLL